MSFKAVSETLPFKAVKLFTVANLYYQISC